MMFLKEHACQSTYNIKIKVIPRRKFTGQTDYEDLYLILNIVDYVLIYKVNKLKEYYPELVGKYFKNNPKAIIEYLDNKLDFLYCEKDMHQYLYIMLEKHNVITFEEMSELRNLHKNKI